MFDPLLHAAPVGFSPDKAVSDQLAALEAWAQTNEKDTRTGEVAVDQITERLDYEEHPVLSDGDAEPGKPRVSPIAGTPVMQLVLK